jgi:hypothetical protein
MHQIKCSKAVNCIIIRNPDTANVIRIGLASSTSATNYESSALSDSYGFIVRPFPFREAYIISSADISNVKIIETVEENIAVLFQNMAIPPTGLVSVTSTVGLQPAHLNIDTTKNLGVFFAGGLPAGVNNIGSVNVAQLPALPTGANTIGSVNVAQLPELPAGTKNIGSINVAQLPALPTGVNTIGSVIITELPESMKPSIDCTIYNIEMTNANTEYIQTIPAGCKKITCGIISNDAIFRLAFETGKVAAPTAPYMQIPEGGFLSEEGLYLTGKTLYFASPTAGKTMQIICWM